VFHKYGCLFAYRRRCVTIEYKIIFCGGYRSTLLPLGSMTRHVKANARLPCPVQGLSTRGRGFKPPPSLVNIVASPHLFGVVISSRFSGAALWHKQGSCRRSRRFPSCNVLSPYWYQIRTRRGARMVFTFHQTSVFIIIITAVTVQRPTVGYYCGHKLSELNMDLARSRFLVSSLHVSYALL